MKAGKLSLRCVPFDAVQFESVVASVCPGLDLEDGAPDQVRYLASYLRHPDLGVRTLVVEQPYVDRHYLEEFRQYYSTAFQPPCSHTTRIHVFAEKFDDAGFNAVFKESATPALIQERLQQSYVGFFVVRPLASAPIGRTVLRPYANLATRVFQSAQTHRVHLCGIELTVEGVPFQQQEVAVGACATTAIWSALASVSRATGSRGPTPYQVTEAATRHVLNDRRFPAQAGLELQQVVAAINTAGFAPHTLKASDDFHPFSFALKSYLASGIPVVLILSEDGGHHAVTAVGYREVDDEQEAQDIRLERAGMGSLVTSGFARIYVHDDRLGPYARMTWSAPDQDSDLPTLSHIKDADATYDYGTEPMSVYAAVVPLYSKVRLSARGLLSGAAELLPLVGIVASTKRDSIRVEARFLLSGHYLWELHNLGADADLIMPFVTSAALPRYVGVVRYFVHEGADHVAVVDAVFDSTDIFRKSPKYGSVLALVPFYRPYASEFAKFANKLPCNQTTER